MVKLTENIKEEAVKKYLTGTPARAICQDIGVSTNTIYNWTKAAGKSRDGTSVTEKALLIKEYQLLTDNKRGEWLRSKGLQTGHITEWVNEMQSESEKKKQLKEENRRLKEELKKSQREIRKKDKALAESAALLVLKKKYQYLWEDEEK